MARKKPIPVIAPEHLSGVMPVKDPLTILRESRERNAQNEEHIAQIVLQEVTHPNGSVGLVPFVIAKPLPDGVRSSMVWPVHKHSHQYFTD